MRLFFIALLSFFLYTFSTTVGAAGSSVDKAINSSLNAKKQTPALSITGAKPTNKDPDSLQMPVNPIRGSAEHTGRLIVMYRDEAGMRAPRIAGTEITNLFGSDTSESSLLLAKYGCTIRQAIDVDPIKLGELRNRANLRSGKSNPDLAAMMLLEGISPSQLLSAAREFLVLQDVAWVEIEKKTELTGPRQDCGQFPLFEPLQCGPLLVVGDTCGLNPLPCEYPHPAQRTDDVPPGPIGNCSDANVCALVNGVRPSCATCWDQVCATLANMLGPSAFGGQGPYDTCLQSFLVQPTRPSPYNCPYLPLEESILIQTSPFIVHPLPGSSNPDCCRAVCFQDVTCCTISWDSSCTGIATGFYGDCYSTPGLLFNGGSPLNPNTQILSPLYDPQMLEEPAPVDTEGSFALALYTTAAKYPDPYDGPNPPPPPPIGPFQPFIDVSGFRGGGLDLVAFQSLLQQFPGTDGPQLPSISVAVIEPSALVNHEDLLDVTGISKVTIEAGQTPLVILDQQNPPPTFSGSFDTAPSHGTATLGVLFANNNKFGVTGIVPDARAFFFPTESFEAQGRLLTAMTNAIYQLSSISKTDPNPGNIIVLPISQNGQPLNSTASPASAALITTGLNSGVTFVLAAGNDSQEILPPVAGSEAAIIAGGVWPGFQNIVSPGSATVFPGLNYCRANLSNYSGDAPATVDVSGWAKGVCTLGYGDLFSGQNSAVSTNPAVASYEVNRLRTYTAVWGGTSAAAAQIGGVAALIQALAKQVYEGQPYSPSNINDVLSDPNNQFAQCGLAAGAQPEFTNALIGNTVGVGDGEPSPIGGFPNMREVGRSVITGNFYDNNQSTFQIVCGTLLSGSQFSIREIDQKYLKTRTARPRNNQSSSGLGPPLFYPTGNRILDVQMIRITNLQSPGDLTRVSVRVTGQTVSVSSALVLAYIYNYQTNRWNVMPPYIGNMTGIPLPLPQFILPACIFPSYVGIPSTTGTKLAARVVVFPLGGLGQAQIWLDQIEIMYNDPLSDQGQPCGQ